MNPSLISAEEAIKLTGGKGSVGNIVFADGSFHLPTTGRDANAEYRDCRINGAIRFDIELIADRQAALPHTMPGPDQFAAMMQGLGINNDDLVIIYDRSVFLSAARPWWMLRYFGHCRVAILNGGLNAWQQAGGQTQSGTSDMPRKTGDFSIRPRCSGDGLASLDRMQELIATPPEQRQQQVLDARSASRFDGSAAEPRPGMASGHMPGALNLPVTDLLDAVTGQVLPLEALRQAVASSGLDLEKPVVTTCGSGVTACGLAFGLHLLGKDDIAVYDGSWSEWGSPDQDRDRCPVATGSGE